MKAYEGDPDTRPCGCIISNPSAAGSRVLIEKCPDAERLWGHLIHARDAMSESKARSKGHKARIDAFAAARESYHAHVRGEGVS